MSMLGVIKKIDLSKEGMAAGTAWDSGLQKIKEAIIGHTPDNEQIALDASVKGIVQSEIRLTANNAWNGSIFYGISDALEGVSVGGELTQSKVKGSSIIKFANTAANATGYSLGTTGPASKKMYKGSSLSGLTVQFKWYTPQMHGWKSAIESLTILAWPTSVFNNGGSGGYTSNTDEAKSANSQNEKLKEAAKSKVALASGLKDVNNILIEAANNINLTNGMTASYKFIDDYPCPAGVPNVKKVQYEQMIALIQSKYDLIAAMSYAYQLTHPTEVGNLITQMTQIRDAYVNALQAENITFDNTINANESQNTTVNPDVPGNSMEFKDRAKLVVDGLGDLVSGMATNLLATNPSIVELMIYSGDETAPNLKYHLRPLVITSFTINGSRETFNGDPVVVTVDITFDYYQTNPTVGAGASQRPQIFAGAKMFVLPDRIAK